MPEIWNDNNPPEFITFHRVSSDFANSLGSLVTTDEVQDAIRSLQSGKTPGPDGFIVEFYKTYTDLLSPLLAQVYESFANCWLPPNLNEATICLLLKKGKDPLECSSYRLISLLNVDLKMLAKVLALRLQQALPVLMSPDQTGFMAGRNTLNNTRWLLNIISSLNMDTPEVILSLDAEKCSIGWSGNWQVCPLSPLLFALAIEPH